MNNHLMTAENLIQSLPQALQDDANINALATSIAEQFVKSREKIRILAIYSRIDELPANLLDILAQDFKVDWWDRNYSLEQKRQTLKDSFMVHRLLGTKRAVETAISSIYPNTTVLEWFEYGGKPYTFRLNINATDIAIDSASHKRVLWLVEYYKNLRSKMGDIIYNVHPKQASLYTAVSCAGYYIREQFGCRKNTNHVEVTIHEVD